MKKLIFVFLLVALIATPLAALDLSAGGDFSFAHAWNTAKIEKVKATASMNFFGINGFFDAEYVRAGLGLNFSVGGLALKANDGEGNSVSETDSKVSNTNFRL